MRLVWLYYFFCQLPDKKRLISAQPCTTLSFTSPLFPYFNARYLVHVGSSRARGEFKPRHNASLCPSRLRFILPSSPLPLRPPLVHHPHHSTFPAAAFYPYGHHPLLSPPTPPSTTGAASASSSSSSPPPPPLPSSLESVLKGGSAAAINMQSMQLEWLARTGMLYHRFPELAGEMKVTEQALAKSAGFYELLKVSYAVNFSTRYILHTYLVIWFLILIYLLILYSILVLVRRKLRMDTSQHNAQSCYV